VAAGYVWIQEDPKWDLQGSLYSPSFQTRRVEDGEETDARCRTKNSCDRQRRSTALFGQFAHNVAELTLNFTDLLKNLLFLVFVIGL
jgi:hypothetical protein